VDELEAHGGGVPGAAGVERPPGPAFFLVLDDVDHERVAGRAAPGGEVGGGAGVAGDDLDRGGKETDMAESASVAWSVANGAVASDRR